MSQSGPTRDQRALMAEVMARAKARGNDLEGMGGSRAIMLALGIERLRAARRVLAKQPHDEESLDSVRTWRPVAEQAADELGLTSRDLNELLETQCTSIN
jgi:hypothetical protein